MNILVTGGCGFIGSNFINLIINKPEVSQIINLDSLTYAADLDNLKDVSYSPKYSLAKLDLSRGQDVKFVFEKYNITHVVHFAAESHVDNSIKGPEAFIKTNLIGTFNLLEVCRDSGVERYHHISTDEVYGALGDSGKFTEQTPYDPQNPYSATKAGSDMLVRAYGNTFGLPFTLSNCSNNYGPRQHKEKFIPVVINSIRNGEMIPIYGKGANIRDWIYVDDHCEAIWEILTRGKDSETYLIGSDCEKTNLEMVHKICEVMEVNPDDYISFVEDRKGHDFRYAIDNTKIKKELNWEPKTDLISGLEETVKFYNYK